MASTIWISDDRLLSKLKTLAKKNRRSVSAENARILEEYFQKTDKRER